MRLKIFYSQISDEVVQIIQKGLKTTYVDVLDIVIEGELELLKEAYSSRRNQYNSDILLNYLINIKKGDAALWVIHEDLYCSGMNFIFGYAMYHKGAVLSISRLSSQDLIEREAIHEVGHVLGLRHCSNYCVMQFSNSLWEAKTKPSYLCDICKSRIKSLINH